MSHRETGLYVFELKPFRILLTPDGLCIARAPACNVIDRSNLNGTAIEEDLCLRKAGILSRSGRRPQ